MTMATDEKGIRILTPADGNYLTDGNVYSKRVFLASNASPEDWEEITDAEAEQRIAEAQEAGEELTAEEALAIITGGAV